MQNVEFLVSPWWLFFSWFQLFESYVPQLPSSIFLAHLELLIFYPFPVGSDFSVYFGWAIELDLGDQSFDCELIGCALIYVEFYQSARGECELAIQGDGHFWGILNCGDRLRFYFRLLLVLIWRELWQWISIMTVSSVPGVIYVARCVFPICLC